MSLLFAALPGRKRPSHAPATWGCQGDSRGHVLPSQTFLSAGGTGRDWKLTPKSLQLSPTFWGATCKPWVQTPRGTTSQWWGISPSTPFCSPVTFQHFNATWIRKDSSRRTGDVKQNAFFVLKMWSNHKKVGDSCRRQITITLLAFGSASLCCLTQNLKLQIPDSGSSAGVQKLWI